MKKSGKVFVFIAVVFILIAILCSCGSDLTKPQPSQSEPVITYTRSTVAEHGFVGDDNLGNIDEIKHFTYEGHRYIQFGICGTYGGNGGFVHDPECLREDLQKWEK